MLYFAPWKTVLIWLTVAVGVAFALPNLYPQSVRDSLPDVVPSDSLALGLDLQGGVHLQLRLDRDDLVEQRLEATRDEVRRLLRAEGIGYTGLSGQGQTVGFTLRDPSDADAMREALADLTTPVTTGLLTGGTVREIVLSGPDANGRYELEITDQGLDYRMAGALTQTVEVIRGRIDELRREVDTLSVPPTTAQGMSERLSRMLQLASDEASEMRAEASAEAAETVSVARQEAAELAKNSREDADRIVSELTTIAAADGGDGT